MYIYRLLNSRHLCLVTKEGASETLNRVFAKPHTNNADIASKESIRRESRPSEYAHPRDEEQDQIDCPYFSTEATSHVLEA